MSIASSTIQVSGLPRQTLAAMKTHAKAEGLSVEGYVKELIETEISITEMARTKSVDEVFAPIQRQFREGGMSEDDLGQLFDAARGEYRNRTTKKKH
jgi:hypothetical protein